MHMYVVCSTGGLQGEEAAGVPSASAIPERTLVSECARPDVSRRRHCMASPRSQPHVLSMGLGLRACACSSGGPVASASLRTGCRPCPPCVTRSARRRAASCTECSLAPRHTWMSEAHVYRPSSSACRSAWHERGRASGWGRPNPRHSRLVTLSRRCSCEDSRLVCRFLDCTRCCDLVGERGCYLRESNRLETRRPWQAIFWDSDGSIIEHHRYLDEGMCESCVSRPPSCSSPQSRR